MRRLLLLMLAMLLFGSLMAPQPGWTFNEDPLMGLHQAMVSEMEEEEPALLPAMEALWRGSVIHSPTLQLALKKMGEKTGNIKPKDKSKWTEGMLRSMVQATGMGGSIMLGNPAPLLGSTVLGRVMAPDYIPKRLTEVTSADLVILAKEIDQTQGQLFQNLVAYCQAREEEKALAQSVEVLQDKAKVLPLEMPQVADTLQTILLGETLKLTQARSHTQTLRHVLVLSAGQSAVEEVDKLIQNKHLAMPQESTEHVPPESLAIPQ